MVGWVEKRPMEMPRETLVTLPRKKNGKKKDEQKKVEISVREKGPFLFRPV